MKIIAADENNTIMYFCRFSDEKGKNNTPHFCYNWECRAVKVHEKEEDLLKDLYILQKMGMNAFILDITEGKISGIQTY